MLMVASVVGAQQRQGASDVSPRLLDGLGNHTHPITTSSPRAQRFFDQGLSLAYAFNHEEAKRSFLEGARLDPACAMCWWGVALVLGPNINASMDPAVTTEAVRAARKASSLGSRV